MTLKGVKQLTYAEYEKAPGNRQSRLCEMQRTPAHFKAACDNPIEPTRAMIIGHVLHTAVLEPNLLESVYYLRPDTYRNAKNEKKKWNSNALECRNWLGEHEDREVLLSKEHEAIIGMRKSVKEHPAAREALKDGLPEQCLFWTDKETGIGLKCRCDWLSGNTIVDLKSTVDASADGFSKSVGEFCYDVQAAFNLDGANSLGLEKEYFLFIAVEKEPPYACAVHELDKASIELGRQKYRRWLSLLSHCMEFDEYPGYDTKINQIRLRDWEFKKEANLLLTG